MWISFKADLNKSTAVKMQKSLLDLLHKSVVKNGEKNADQALYIFNAMCRPNLISGVV